MSNLEFGFRVEYVSSFGTPHRWIRAKFELELIVDMPNMPTGQIWNLVPLARD